MENLLVLIGFIILFIIIVFYCEYMIKRTKQKNHVYFYVAKDKNGELFLYLGKPFRGITMFHPNPKGCVIENNYNFSNFGLNQDDYSNLKWEDEPVEVFINVKD